MKCFAEILLLFSLLFNETLRGHLLASVYFNAIRAKLFKSECTHVYFMPENYHGLYQETPLIFDGFYKKNGDKDGCVLGLFIYCSSSSDRYWPTFGKDGLRTIQLNKNLRIWGRALVKLSPPGFTSHLRAQNKHICCGYPGLLE